MDFLDEIRKYVVSQASLVQADTSVGVHPAKPENVVSFLGLPGSTLTSARDVPGLQFPRFQLFVRNKDFLAASAIFQEVRASIHGLIGLILPVGADTETDDYIRVMRCHVEQEGGPIGEDAGRYEFSCNFIAEYHYVEGS